MSSQKEYDICPVEHAGALDTSFRRWFQNPRKILKPYLREGMTALDLGCGPGFFTMDMAQMVGSSGKVIAADSQTGMLEKVRSKMKKSDVRNIELQQTLADSIGVSEKVDFVLAFYVMHELGNREKILQEVKNILKPEGIFLIAEPAFHVTRKGFLELLNLLDESGFELIKKPSMFLSQAAVLRRKD